LSATIPVCSARGLTLKLTLDKKRGSAGYDDTGEGQGERLGLA
jgi:hypothetical protein